MPASIFLARLIGPLFVAIGVGMLVNGSAYRVMAAEFLHSPAMIYLSGLIALVAGLAIVNVHNTWYRDWRAIITVLGWLATIGGVFRIVWPQLVTRIGTAIYAQRGIAAIAGVFVLALGGFVSFKGYSQSKKPPLGAAQ